MTFGIDIGTTSVAGVAVDSAGKPIATVTRAHEADLPGAADGVHEQDPAKLLAVTRTVLAELEGACGRSDGIGWTGQMHGVVGVDRELNAVTPFVTWRDARRFGGPVMAGWAHAGMRLHKCLPICGWVVAAMTGRCTIDPTFLESWHLERASGPREWIPEVDAGAMLGDNQAGVYAAQRLVPGAAVVNIGTSGQLSVVADGLPRGDLGAIEERPYPGGKTLRCRASLVGGKALADLQARLGIPWDELNEQAECNGEIASCIAGIVSDLSVGMDLSQVSELVGVGNALTRNPAVKRALERHFGRACRIPDVAEMAAYGAALFAMDWEQKDVGEMRTTCVNRENMKGV